MCEKMCDLLEAVELAKGIMDFCGCDSYEMECTFDARKRFDEIYGKHIKESKHPEPDYEIGEDEWRCNVCGKVMMKAQKNDHLKGKKHIKKCIKIEGGK